MTIRNLDALLRPSSVALISERKGPSPIGLAAVRNLVSAGFKGDLFFVDPTHDFLEGVPCLPDAASLPKAPDLAVIDMTAHSIPALVDFLGRMGTRAAVILSEGWTDGTGDRELKDVLLDAAEPHLLRIVGPGSLGIIVPLIGLHASVVPSQPLPGSLAFIAQSDAVASAVFDWAVSRDIGFSHFVCLGDMVDVDYGDMLDYLANEYRTRAILLHMEKVTHARKFMSAARAAARLKPVIVLKGGRHREKIPEAESHMSAMVSSDAVHRSAFRRAGMLRVNDLREFFDAVETLASARSVVKDKLIIVSNGVGTGVLAADVLLDEGGSLAELSPETQSRLEAILPQGRCHGNPIDIRWDASPERYADVLGVIEEDSRSNAVLLLHSPSAAASGAEVARTIADTVRASLKKAGSPQVLAGWLGGAAAAEATRICIENGIPAYETPMDAVRGFMQLVRYRRNQEMLTQTPPSIPSAFVPEPDRVQRAIDRVPPEGEHWLTSIDAREILDAYRIPVMPDGEPTKRRLPDFELIIGMVEDPQFGPIILFGHGGTAVEAIQDTALALPPLNMHLARELMERTRVVRLLNGRRGKQTAVLESLALTLVKVSQLVCDTADIVEIEINPLMADAERVSVLDARIKVKRSSANKTVATATQRLAIRPYPRELEEVVQLPHGGALLVRPIRPEDEPALQRLFAVLSPEEIRMRFLHPMRTLSRAAAVRFTQIDYDREMCLVLASQALPGEAELYGSASISADPDNQRAEFAILLRRDMTGMGLGPMLMRRIIEYAKHRGVRELYGDVLSENRAMLRLCNAFAFTTRSDPDDSSIKMISLAL